MTFRTGRVVPVIDSSGGGTPTSSRALVKPADDYIMDNRSFFVLQQLRLCESIKPQAPSKYCGFECIHCQGKGFCKFPDTLQKMARQLVTFQTHLEECTEFTLKSRRSMNTLEEGQVDGM